jgi:hypothetical protein
MVSMVVVRLLRTGAVVRRVQGLGDRIRALAEHPDRGQMIG